MSLFFLTYLVIYGGMHAYLFVKVRAAFPRMGRRWRLLLIVCLALLFAAPMAVRRLDGGASIAVARVTAFVTFVWMAVLLWWFVLLLCSDVWNLVARALGRFVPKARGLALRPRPALAVSAVLVVFACVWGLVEASAIQVTEITIRTRYLPAGSRPLRLVQISDVHLGLLVGEGRLRRIVDLVKSLEPDILVSTGDLVDSSLDHSPNLAPMLAEVGAPLGKFACTGNHEFYPGLEKTLAFHEAAGFRVLRGESVVIGGRLRIGGVDDPSHRGMRREKSITDESLALPASSPRVAAVLLKHRPVVLDASAARFDLQLSGHVHGGQIFPFGLITRLFNPYAAGLHRLKSGAHLYVSRGAGTWGPPLRFFAPPEVTLIIITGEGT
ncbi:MAG: metallophosphoesterase [Planctomycetota bacterium]